MKVSTMTEYQIQEQIEDYLRKTGWLVITQPHLSGKQRFKAKGLKGRSDILALKNGKFVAIECKTVSGTLTVAQYNFLEEVRKHGGMAIVGTNINSVKGL